MCWALLVSVLSVHAQDAAGPRLLAPTNNIAAARSKYPLSDLGRIATNTPAFEEWGVTLMLTKANEVRVKWALDIEKPLTVNDVLFQLKATVHGLAGGIGTRDERFSWRFSRNTLEHFYDSKYRPRSFRHKDEKSARLAKISSKVSASDAEAIARDALHRLGLDERQLRLSEPPSVNQYTFEENDGIVYPLPTFNIAWRLEGYPEPEGDEAEFQPVVFRISGITKGVVEYFNVCPYTPTAPLPANYFEMLGLPDNYLETLPETTRLRLGLAPKPESGVPQGKPD